jgi:hypothetical protein
MKTLAAAILAGIAIAGATPILADGNDASLYSAVEQVYNDVQARYTPTLQPNFRRIVWDGYHGGNLGSGLIVDADPRLGGSFKYMWGLGSDSPGVGYRVVPAQPQAYSGSNLANDHPSRAPKAPSYFPVTQKPAEGANPVVA